MKNKILKVDVDLQERKVYKKRDLYELGKMRNELIDLLKKSIVNNNGKMILKLRNTITKINKILKYPEKDYHKHD